MLRLVPTPWWILAIALLLAGLLLGVFGLALGALIVGGLGAIALVSLVFYAVGRSEDLERERDAQRRRP